jgi:hypothetical protein
MQLQNRPPDARSSGRFGSLQAAFTKDAGELSWKSVISIPPGAFDAKAYAEFLRSRQDLVNGAEPALLIRAP